MTGSNWLHFFLHFNHKHTLSRIYVQSTTMFVCAVSLNIVLFHIHSSIHWIWSTPFISFSHYFFSSYHLKPPKNLHFQLNTLLWNLKKINSVSDGKILTFWGHFYWKIQRLSVVLICLSWRNNAYFQFFYFFQEYHFTFIILLSIIFDYQFKLIWFSFFN